MHTINKSEFDFNRIINFKSLLLNFLGVLTATIAFKSRMFPKLFLIGGLLGNVILIHEFCHIDIWTPLLLLSLLFVIISFKKIDKSLALNSLLDLVLFGIFLYNLPILEITKDYSLVVAFDGNFLGLGIGFGLQRGGILDGLEKTMCSIITFFTAIKVSEYVVDSFEKLICLNLVLPNDKVIKDIIVNKFDKPNIVCKSQRGNQLGIFTISSDCDIAAAVVARIEVYKIKKVTTQNTPKAFMLGQDVNEVNGGSVNRESYH